MRIFAEAQYPIMLTFRHSLSSADEGGLDDDMEGDGGVRSGSELSSEDECDRDGGSDVEVEVDADREKAHSGRHKAPPNTKTGKPSASCKSQSKRAETGKRAATQKKSYSKMSKEYKAGGDSDLSIVH